MSAQYPEQSRNLCTDLVRAGVVLNRGSGRGAARLPKAWAVRHLGSNLGVGVAGPQAASRDRRTYIHTYIRRVGVCGLVGRGLKVGEFVQNEKGLDRGGSSRISDGPGRELRYNYSMSRLRSVESKIMKQPCVMSDPLITVSDELQYSKTLSNFLCTNVKFDTRALFVGP